MPVISLTLPACDCGFAQEWDLVRVHPSIQWAKLQSLHGFVVRLRASWTS